MPSTDLVLASASPRRAALLRAAGIAFDVAPADVDETTLPGEAPEAYVRRLAAAKAAAVADAHPYRHVLGSDTTVVLDGEILGKPVDADDARRMLTRLAARTHTVLTAVCLVQPARAAGGGAGPVPGRGSHTEVAATRVDLLPLSKEEIDWYVATGEPMDKAGGYAIQGLASRFVARIEGSYSNVVGLPVSLVWDMLRGG